MKEPGDTHHKPPRVAAAILSWLLDDDWDTPAGDFEEYFNELARKRSVKWARRWYRRQVLVMAPTRLLFKTAWGIGMLLNNMKVAFRTMKRNAWYAALNIGGLAVGLAACLLIGLFVHDELTFDGMHENAPNIVRIVEAGQTSDGGEQHAVYTMGPLGPTLTRELPEVRNHVRMLSRWTVGRQTVQYDDARFYEAEYLGVDSTFFDVFDYRFVAGDRESALDAPGKVVLTQSAARKYFGQTYPMGKTLSMERNGDFEVTGIVEDPPPDTHLHFSMLFSISTFESNESWYEYMRDWESDNFVTYLLLEDGASLASVQEKMDALIAANAPEEVVETRRAYLQPMSDIHFGSAHIEFDENAGRSSRGTVFMLALIAFLILAIACINYVNISTAASIRRAREVGLRKVVGAYRGQLVKQFLSEAFAVALIAFVVSLAIAWLTLPAFSRLAGKHLALNPFQDPWVGIGMIVFVFAVALLSGGYPALFLARYKPAAVLKGGGPNAAGSARLRRGLVVVQFAFSIGLIMASLVVHNQLSYVQSANLGFNESQLVVVDINGGGPRQAFRAMKSELGAHPSVVNVSVSSSVPGDWKNIRQIEVRNRDSGSEQLTSAYFLGIDADFLDTFEIELLEGRNLTDMGSADSLSVLVTASTAEQLGLSIGDQIHVPGSSLRSSFSETSFEPSVVGIVNDFNYLSLHEDIDPMVLAFHSNPIDVIDYFTIRVAGNTLSEAVPHLREVGERFDPDHPFEFNFLDERLNDFYLAQQRLGWIFGIATGLAVVIACLGLFGLAAFTTAARTKEIGVRKVLGATAPAIVMLLSKDIVRLVGVAFVVAVPVAWLAMDSWLQSFAFRVDLGVGVAVFAGFLALLFALGTVGYQSFRAATAAPVKSLRYE